MGLLIRAKALSVAGGVTLEDKLWRGEDAHTIHFLAASGRRRTDAGDVDSGNPRAVAELLKAAVCRSGLFPLGAFASLCPSKPRITPSSRSRGPGCPGGHGDFGGIREGVEADAAGIGRGAGGKEEGRRVWGRGEVALPRSCSVSARLERLPST